MAIRVNPSGTNVDLIRRKIEESRLLAIQVDDLRSMIALLEKQIALERSIFLLSIQ
jgi:hypothetical protein